MKNILVLLLIILSITVYAQPANDTCYQANQVVLTNGHGTFSGNTQGATPSNSGSFADNCLSNLGQPIEDVWFKFNSGLGGSFKVDINSGSLNDSISFDVVRGLCNSTIQILFSLGCIYDTISGCSPTELKILYLDPNVEYWIRVTSHGNPTSFTGTITPYNAVLLNSITTGNIDSNCIGTIWDSGGSLSNYSPLEDYTYIIAPKDTHDYISFHIKDYDFEAPPSIDGLYFYKGNSINPSNLISVLKGSGTDTTIQIFTTDSVTVHFQSDTAVQLAGFEMDYECSLMNYDDIAVIEILKNGSDCFMSMQDTISVVIQNLSKDTVGSFPVSYQVSNTLISTEIFSKILPPCSIDTFTFVQTVNLVNAWNSSIVAWTDLSTDSTATNDTLEWKLNCICYDTLGTPYVCNQVMIQYEENATQSDINQIITDLSNSGGYLIDSVQCDNIRLDLWSLPNILNWFGNTYINSESQVEGLKTTTAKIKEVDLNYISNSSSIDFKQNYPKNKFVNNFKTTIHQYDKIEQIVQTQNSNDTVKIVVLDTGYDKVNLSSNIGYHNCPTCSGLPQNFSVGYDFVNMDNEPLDDNGHGTNITSVITRFANTNNLDNYHLIPIKVLDENGEGTLWNISLGVLIAKSLNADIVNASFGWVGSESEILYGLIDALGDSCHGIFITSAGNESANNDLITHHPSNGTQFLDNIISVAAFDIDTSSNKIAWYSNYGLSSVDVVASGNFNDGQTLVQGTSIAAAQVTGHILKSLSQNPSITAKQVKSCINNINVPTLDYLNNVVVNHTLDSVTALNFFNCTDTTTVDASCHIHSCFTTSIQRFHQPSIDFKVYPNPFTNEVNFKIDFDEPQEIYLTVYDITGRVVYNVYKPYVQGHQKLIWNTNELPNGVYFCHLKTTLGSGVVKLVKQ